MSNTRATPVTQPDQGHALPCSERPLGRTSCTQRQPGSKQKGASHSLYTLLTRAPPRPRPRPRPLPAGNRPSEQGIPHTHVPDTPRSACLTPASVIQARSAPTSPSQVATTTRAGSNGGASSFSAPNFPPIRESPGEGQETKKNTGSSSVQMQFAAPSRLAEPFPRCSNNAAPIMHS